MAFSLGKTAKALGQATKKVVVRKIGNAMFGQGIIGRAMSKTFMDKFGDKEEDTRVAEALSEQGSLQDSVNSTLIQIEQVVTNISDNVYNIAGVLNAQVTSMQEAKRLQEQRAFAQAASEEEMSDEATQIASPLPSGTTPTASPKKEEGGGITKIIKSLLSTKKMFGGFLKTFALIATGLVGLATLSGWFGKGDENKKGDFEEPTPEDPNNLDPQFGGGGATGSWEESSGNKPTLETAPQTTPVSPPKAESTSPQSTATSASSVATTLPSQATPVSTPSVAGTAPSPPTDKDQEVVALKSYFDQPQHAGENAALDQAHNTVKSITDSINQEQAIIASTSDPAVKMQHRLIIEKTLEPALAAAKQQKRSILNTARNALKAKTATPQPPSPTPVTSVTPDKAITNISLSGGGAPSPMNLPPSPSTGASIASLSTQVAAANEMSPPKNEMLSTDATTSLPKPADVPPIPSPVANRGSIERNTVFSARY